MAGNERKIAPKEVRKWTELQGQTEIVQPKVRARTEAKVSSKLEKNCEFSLGVACDSQVGTVESWRCRPSLILCCLQMSTLA